jgi:hypothetical protein
MITHVDILEQNSTNVGRHVIGGVKRKVVSEVLRKYDVCVWSKMMFLTPTCQGTTPQILKLKIPAHTLGQKQKRK